MPDLLGLLKSILARKTCLSFSESLINEDYSTNPVHISELARLHYYSPYYIQNLNLWPGRRELGIQPETPSIIK